MVRIASLAAALALPATSLAAQPTAPAPLSLEHRMLLRCSAAFALVATRQDAGDAEALAYPPLKERGREFFVRASAKVMDEAKLDRAALAEAMRSEAEAMVDAPSLDQIMPPCLDALTAAGL